MSYKYHNYCICFCIVLHVYDIYFIPRKNTIVPRIAALPLFRKTSSTFSKKGDSMEIDRFWIACTTCILLSWSSVDIDPQNGISRFNYRHLNFKF